jgi:hypothetical protein
MTEITAPKKRGVKKGSKGNNPYGGIGKNKGLIVEPGDNARYLASTLAIANLPKIDLYDPDAVADRLQFYYDEQFKCDEKPTVSGLAMALGIDRRRLWEYVTGAQIGGRKEVDLPRATLDLLKNAYKINESLWEKYMQNGKVNPIAGIFLGKNHFGYRDVVDHAYVDRSQEDGVNADDIRKRYIEGEGSIVE